VLRLTENEQRHTSGLKPASRSSSNSRISFSRSRLALTSFGIKRRSSCSRQGPIVVRGWTSRSYWNFVALLRKILRTVLRDIFKSPLISRIDRCLIKCSRRTRAIVSTLLIPKPPAQSKSRQSSNSKVGHFGCRFQCLGDQNWTPNHRAVVPLSHGTPKTPKSAIGEAVKTREFSGFERRVVADASHAWHLKLEGVIYASKPGTILKTWPLLGLR
jgi:hypothetical protein